MSINNVLLRGNPIWNQNTLVTAVAAGSSARVLPVPLLTNKGGSATSVIVSNTGPVNLFIGSSSTEGILLQPGASIQLSVESSPYVHDPAGSGTWSIVAFE